MEHAIRFSSLSVFRTNYIVPGVFFSRSLIFPFDRFNSIWFFSALFPTNEVSASFRTKNRIQFHLICCTLHPERCWRYFSQTPCIRLGPMHGRRSLRCRVSIEMPMSPSFLRFALVVIAVCKHKSTAIFVRFVAHPPLWLNFLPAALRLFLFGMNIPRPHLPTVRRTASLFQFESSLTSSHSCCLFAISISCRR